MSNVGHKSAEASKQHQERADEPDSIKWGDVVNWTRNIGLTIPVGLLSLILWKRFSTQAKADGVWPLIVLAVAFLVIWCLIEIQPILSLKRRRRLRERDAPPFDEWYRIYYGNTDIDPLFLREVLSALAAEIDCEITQLRPSDRFNEELRAYNKQTLSIDGDTGLICFTTDIHEMIRRQTRRRFVADKDIMEMTLDELIRSLWRHINGLDDVVRGDLGCVGCGYNLRTLKLEGSCPECGRPVDDSMRV
jgi:hypothetical protein